MLDFDLRRRSPPRPLTDKLAPRLTLDDAPVASRLVEPTELRFPVTETADPLTPISPPALIIEELE